ncbi:MAG: thioredoxin family protein [Chloroflexi bacterium]|nr:thioredoxin family protein [Chloroflexota bacterium]
MAVDAQGPEKPRSYVDRANTTFPTVVDAENRVGQAFNYKAIPNGILVDGGGTVVFTKFGGFDIRRPEYAQLLEGWVQGVSTSRLGQRSQGEAEEGMKPLDALEYYRQGLALYRQGRIQEAVAEWRKGVQLEPDNFIIRKQVWAVEHPERFYAGKVDYAWQREQMAQGR